MKGTKKSSVLACVTGQYDCARIISAAREIADSCDMPMHVLCVLNARTDYGKISGELEFLYRTAKNQGADMTIMFDDNAPKAAADFARLTGCRRIVTGMHDGKSDSFLVVFNRLRPELPITMVDKNGAMFSMEPVSHQIKE